MGSTVAAFLLILTLLRSASGQDCLFEVVGNPDAGGLAKYVGHWYASNENHNGKPIYVQFENHFLVFQWSGSGFDMCTRSTSSGRSSCGGNSGRAGHKSSNLSPGNIGDWCSSCALKIINCRPTTTTTSITVSTTTKTTTATTSTATTSTATTTTETRTTSSSTSLTTTSTSSSTSTESSTTTSSSSTTSTSTTSTSTSSSSSSSSSTTTSSSYSTTSTSTLTSTSTSSSSSSSTTSSSSSSSSTSSRSSTSSTTSTSSSSSTSTSSSSTTSSSSSTSTSSSSTSTSSSSTSSTSTTSTSTTTSSSATTSTSTLTTSTTTTLTVTTTSSTSSSSSSSSSTTSSSSSSTSSSTSTSSWTSSTTSSTTETRLSEAEQVQSLIEAVQEAGNALLSSLEDNNETLLVARGPASDLAVARLDKLPTDGEDNVVLTAPLQGADVSVVLPLSALSGISGLVALSVAAFNPGASEASGAISMVEINLMALGNGDHKVIEISGLQQPIAFTLPTNYTPGVACAYWEEETGMWSTNGVATRQGRSLDDKLECSTTHLSLFAAIWQGFVATFACSQASLLTLESIKLIGQGDWYKQTAPIFFWCYLLLCLLGFGIAAKLDAYSAKNFSWQRHQFLVPEGLPPEVEEEDEMGARKTEDGAENLPPMQIMPSVATEVTVSTFRAVATVTATGASCWAWAVQSNSLRDALDDAMSTWCSYFGEVRSFLEDTFKDINCTPAAICSGKMAAHGYHALSSLVLLASRRLSASTLRVSTDLVEFVLHDGDLQELLVEAHRAEQARYRASGTPRENPSATSQSRADKWAFLHDEVTTEMQAHLVRHDRVSLANKAMHLFVFNHPMMTLFVFDIFTDRKMRLFLFTLDVTLTIMVICFFFEVAGTKRSMQIAPDHCKLGSAALGVRIGRFLAVAIGSAFIGSVPVQLLICLQTVRMKKVPYEGSTEWHRALRAWRAQDRIVYTVGALLHAFGIFFITLFLANVSLEDHSNWMVTVAILLVQDYFILPLAVALVLPMMGQVLMRLVTHSAHSDSSSILRSINVSYYRQTNAMLPQMHV